MCLTTTPVHGQIRYHATDVAALLGLSGRGAPTVINDLGQMAGTYKASDGESRGFFYDGANLIDLGSLPGESLSPYAMNDAGQIVGSFKPADFRGRAFLYSEGRIVDLGALPGGDISVAWAINRAGQVVGRSAVLGMGQRGVLWSEGQMIDLGSLGGHWTEARAINNSGQIAGYSYVMDFTPSHAFLYSDGKMHDLGVAGGVGSAANDLNDAAQVVGYIGYSGSVRHAMSYSNGKMVDLGTLGGPWSEAFAINNAGVIVGESYSTPVGGLRAFVCLDGLMLDLNALTDLPAGVEALIGAFAINNRGQILCHTATAAGYNIGPLLLNPMTGSSTLANFSFRAPMGSGERMPLVGFVVRDGTKPVLLRASGPTLATFGLATPAPDPRLSLFNGTGMLETNEDWSDSENAPAVATATAHLGAFSLPAGSKDAALLTSLPAGAYTVQTGASQGNGIVLTEIYDGDVDAAARICNASGRAYVGTGDDVAIAGFMIRGDVPKAVLMRAIGPTLSAFGVTEVLSNPQLTVYREGAIIGGNDDWGLANNSGLIATAAQRVGAFTLKDDSKDAAVLMTLRPGAYSVHVSGVAGTTGISLVEIYDVL